MEEQRSASFLLTLCSDRDQVVHSEGESVEGVLKADSDGKNLEIVASSPGWSLEADLNLGTGIGVRRRVSPRAGDHSFCRRAEAGGGTGWAPLSPQRQEETLERSDDEYDGDDRLRPRMVTFQSSSEARTKMSEEGSSTYAQQSFESKEPHDDMGWLSKDAPSSLPTHGCTDVHKPLDGAGAQYGAVGRVLGGNLCGGVEAKAKTYQDQDGGKGGATRAATDSRVGLKCSMPIYPGEGEKNVPGGDRVPISRGQQASSRSLCPLRSSEAKPESGDGVGNDIKP